MSKCSGLGSLGGIANWQIGVSNRRPPVLKVISREHTMGAGGMPTAFEQILFVGGILDTGQRG